MENHVNPKFTKQVTLVLKCDQLILKKTLGTAEMRPLDQRWSPSPCGEAALSRWLVRGQETLHHFSWARCLAVLSCVSTNTLSSQSYHCQRDLLHCLLLKAATGEHLRRWWERTPVSPHPPGPPFTFPCQAPRRLPLGELSSSERPYRWIGREW